MLLIAKYLNSDGQGVFMLLVLSLSCNFFSLLVVNSISKVLTYFHLDVTLEVDIFDEWVFECQKLKF